MPRTSSKAFTSSLIILLAMLSKSAIAQPTFTNPIAAGADPWVVRDPNQSRYLYCASVKNRSIAIWTGDRMTELGERHVVWKAPPAGPYHAEVWAPELHFLDGHWCIYFAASDGDNKNHLAYVLKSETDDPLGKYTLHGPMATGDGPDGKSPNIWAIDMTVLQLGEQRYAVWSGWDAPGTDQQYLYIAPMKSSTELAGPRVMLCDNDDYLWERVEPDTAQRGLNEGPEVFQSNGRTCIVYSCGASWLPTYKLGLLELIGTDPLDPASWHKHEQPVFESTDEVYGVGHSCFVKSLDDKEWWHFFHAKDSREPGWTRSIFLQPMSVDERGLPDFGQPQPVSKPQSLPSNTEVSIVKAPNLSQLNKNYTANRAPLLPNALIALPVGSVHPEGWLLEMLRRQRAGLTGQLGQISSWLQKEDNAWLNKDGKGEYGWEELPYWLKGYIELAYLFEDPAMMQETQVWIEGTLASQRADGDFGPDQRFADGSRDYWANMVMLFCLESYYEHTQDQRVLDLMTRYFKYQASVPDIQMLTGYWQRMRGGDNLHSIYWLYNRTGDAELFAIAEKIHRCTANWTMKNDLPNWHNVNIAECFREPAQFYQQSRNPSDLRATYENFDEVRRRYGQVPGGMFGGDENCRVGYDDPRQATETCGFVEQMQSDEMLLQITGDTFWADHCEQVAFNSYPAAVMPDFKSLRYLTAPNMVLSDSSNHAPGIDNSGPFLMMNPFSSRCCQHNHSHGWPYFSKYLWMATPDNGVCAAMYSASKVDVKVADGIEVHFTEQTHYPFDDTLEFKFAAEQSVSFPLYLRIPAWCEKPELTINGLLQTIEPNVGSYLKISRQWTDQDKITLKLPMNVSVKRWARNHNSASVDYGPLTFSLKIGEQYIQRDSKETAIGDSSWQAGADPSAWPSFEIHPTTAWNYGLMLDTKDATKSFEVHKLAWPSDDFPFTADAAPLSITCSAKQIPNWTLDRNALCAILQDSPVQSDTPEQKVELIPMGAARLRISAFPVIGEGPKSHKWIAATKPHESLYKISASHTFATDSLAAVDDGLVPDKSGDLGIPRFTWWDHRGTKEWIQYDFETSKEVTSVSVYWFDDTDVGQCRIPASWKVLVRQGDQWVPAQAAESEGIAIDKFNTRRLEPIKTSSIRLEVQLQKDFSGGVLEWQIQ